MYFRVGGSISRTFVKKSLKLCRTSSNHSTCFQSNGGEFMEGPKTSAISHVCVHRALKLEKIFE